MLILSRLIRQAVCVIWLLSCASSYAQQASRENSTSPAPSIPSIEQQLRNTISLWAGAWAAQIPEPYFEFYTERYIAPGFDSRLEWMTDRRQKIEGPEYIRIRLLDFELVETTELLADELLAIIRFTMIYERPGHSDSTIKEIELISRRGEWKISVENNIQVEVLKN